MFLTEYQINLKKYQIAELMQLKLSKTNYKIAMKLTWKFF